MFAINSEKVTPMDRDDVERFQVLMGRRDKLKEPGKKQLARLEVKLRRRGILVTMTKADLHIKAAAMYHALPFMRKWQLKFAFRMKMFTEWLQKVIDAGRR